MFSIALLRTCQRGEGNHGGLNPSSHEFRPERRWPREIEPIQLADRLFTYFSSEQTCPHPWSHPQSTVLSEMGLGYSRDAAHIDLSPRPTNASRLRWRANGAANNYPSWRSRDSVLLLFDGSAHKGRCHSCRRVPCKYVLSQAIHCRPVPKRSADKGMSGTDVSDPAEAPTGKWRSTGPRTCGSGSFRLASRSTPIWRSHQSRLMSPSLSGGVQTRARSVRDWRPSADYLHRGPAAVYS